jgi:hypothetical protein
MLDWIPGSILPYFQYENSNWIMTKLPWLDYNKMSFEGIRPLKV